MDLPKDLRFLLDQRHRAMDHDQHHRLLPIHRQSIYRALDAKNIWQQNQGRARLALVTARYVFPIWEQRWKEDNLMPQILATAEMFIEGTIPLQEARSIAFTGSTYLEDLGEGGLPSDSQLSAFFAGDTIVCALYEVIGIRPFDKLRLDVTTTDEDLDPYVSDSPQWAASAVTDYLRNSPEDIVKRQRLWTWWLLEAIPLAWHSSMSPAT